MTHRPGGRGASRVEAPPLDPSVLGTRWIVVAASVIGILTVLLVGTTVAVTKSGSPNEPKASAPVASATPSEVRTTAAEGSTNLECDGRFIVEIARSSETSADAAVEQAAARERGGKFLDATASCATYESEGVRRVAYLGPFDTLKAACRARVEAGDPGAVLRKMDADGGGPRYCLCRDALTLPGLRSGAGTDGDPATLIAIGEVQRMLKALGFFKPKINGDPYGPRTVAAVQAFQTDRRLFASGAVDQPTLTALRRSKDSSGSSFC